MIFSATLTWDMPAYIEPKSNVSLFLLPLALQHTLGFGLSKNVLSFFSYLPPSLSIFSLPALEDIFLNIS